MTLNSGGEAASQGSEDGNVAYLVYAPSGVLLFICPILLILRLWVRSRVDGKLKADDLTALIACFFGLLTSAVLIASCQHGVGRHWADLGVIERRDSLKYLYVSRVMDKLSLDLAKCSVVLFYLRVFGKIRWFRCCCICLMVIIGGHCFAAVFAVLFQCQPPRKAWRTSIDGACIDNGQFWLANAGFSIATDVIILMLPMRLVFALRGPGLRRVALTVLFALGLFVLAASSLRMMSIDALATTSDITYDITYVMWTIIEVQVALVTANLSALGPLLGLCHQLKGRTGRYLSPSKSSDKRPGVSQSQWPQPHHADHSAMSIVIERSGEAHPEAPPNGVLQTTEFSVLYPPASDDSLRR
ncbi:putative PTH11-typeG-protein-coupled receptor [Emericellopsis atlantica]|uniref:PTH11-typeG-protein-coupled receptor n=1 Tax=Emericellopsis atlantica TaxID=2614577 RepID=A0A9P7ZFE5_9HYPO|nr:putative PTH11-typeG-protein-coupled receptor [Emericellopsis atlantica]KAG9250667.1 putative PTH11-typeG-protein-coupled receptor [Emericellopsis atlantica]